MNAEAKEQERTVKGKKLFLEALVLTLGNISMACKKANLSRQVYYDWFKTDKEFKEQCEEIKESNLDFAESKLLSHIKDDNVTALIFYLKTQGKNRGYIERTEVDEVDREPIQVSIIRNSIDEH
jgi:hypothetical protein